jgi:hypothetical protein
MGTFAETANGDYRSLFARQGKKNFSFPFAKNKRKFAASVFCLQQTNGSCLFLLVPFSSYKHIYTESI